MNGYLAALVSVAITLVMADPASAQHYYQSSAGTINFVKANFADPDNPANWDMISPSVAITRANNQGIYNPLVESEYQGFSPTGTLWYFGGTVQDVINGTITLSQFDNWVFAHNNHPPSTVGVNGVVYLEAEDAFVDIRFTQWTQGSSGGGFRYTRAIVPPPPACPGDITGAAGVPDGQVGVEDLNAILGAWETAVGVGSPLDLAGDDGVVNVDDLNVILTNWQGCD